LAKKEKNIGCPSRPKGGNGESIRTQKKRERGEMTKGSYQEGQTELRKDCQTATRRERGKNCLKTCGKPKNGRKIMRANVLVESQGKLPRKGFTEVLGKAGTRGGEKEKKKLYHQRREFELSGRGKFPEEGKEKGVGRAQRTKNAQKVKGALLLQKNCPGGLKGIDRKRTKEIYEPTQKGTGRDKDRERGDCLLAP